MSSQCEHANKIAGTLILGGANVNAQDEFGTSALMVASKMGKYRLVKELCTSGAEVDAKDKYRRTAMHHAARYGHELVCIALNDEGANADARDWNGWTPLMMASRWGHVNVVSFLIREGVLVNTRERKTGKSSLMIAAERGHATVIQQLLEVEDLDSHIRDIHGAKAINLLAGAATTNSRLASAVEDHMNGIVDKEARIAAGNASSSDDDLSDFMDSDDGL